MRAIKGVWFRLKLIYALHRAIRATNKWLDAIKTEEKIKAANRLDQLQREKKDEN